MDDLFLPITQGKPTLVTVNGHQLLFISEDEDAFFESDYLAAIDNIVPVEITQTPNQTDTTAVPQFNVSNAANLPEEAFGALSDAFHAGVVLVPHNAHVDEIIGHLEHELPWVQ